MRYLSAVLWFSLSLVASCANDAITKYVAERLHPWEIAFCRFLWGALTILPLMLYQGRKSFKTHRPLLHLGRGTVLFIATSLWIQGVNVASITTATIMSFAVPIFVLLLAPILLQERITWPTWLATLVGFAGTMLALRPQASSFNSTSLYFLLASMLFGLLDIINKRYVAQEPTLCTLFHTTLVAAVLVALPASHVWRTPSRYELLWLLALGGGGNLILYLLLRAFAIAEASSLAPFRYLQLLIATGIDCFLFQELPKIHSYLGATLIILCTLFVGYQQRAESK
ncbi:MAG: DMT family transporter [Bacteroidota bacterium]